GIRDKLVTGVQTCALSDLDIKHVFAQNPLHPVFRKRTQEKSEPPAPMTFVDFEETIATIGHDGHDFSYDNEGPRHRALVPSFSQIGRASCRERVYISVVDG